MGNKVEKKILPEYFNAIADGKKKYELRLNDFNIKEGDTLILKEIDPKTKQFTGRSISKQVVGVDKFGINNLFWSKGEIEEKGLQIISFE